jgi:hypothetical protein
MPELIREKRFRNYIIIAVILLIAIAAVVFFVLRDKKSHKTASETEQNFNPGSDPTVNEPSQAKIFITFYSTLDTARLSQDLNLLSTAFRQVVPVIDQWLRKTSLGSDPLTNYQQDYVANSIAIRNDPGSVTNSKTLKLTMEEGANLFDSICRRVNLDMQKNIDAMHQLAKDVPEKKEVYFQQNYIGPYFSNLNAVIKELDKSSSSK